MPQRDDGQEASTEASGVQELFGKLVAFFTPRELVKFRPCVSADRFVTMVPEIQKDEMVARLEWGKCLGNFDDALGE